MAPAQYLLHVNSRPTQTSDEVWKKWYIDEHLPDLVKSGTSVRASFYEEVVVPGGQGPENPRKFLALYQSDFQEPLSTKNYTDLRTTSELFKPGSSKSDAIAENGDFDARNYELIQHYDPLKKGEGKSASSPFKEQHPDFVVAPAPYLATAEIQPLDPVDYDKWYREEHLDMLSKMPSYRRSLRYKIGPKTPLTQGTPPSFIAIHEVDDATKALASQELVDVNSTPWTQKHMKEADPFIMRVWKLLHSEGF